MYLIKMTVRWENVPETVKKLASDTFQVIATETITIKPNSHEVVDTGIVGELSRGVVAVVLNESLKSKLKCYTGNVLIVESGVFTVKIDIRNNSKRVVTINVGENICIVRKLFNKCIA